MASYSYEPLEPGHFRILLLSPGEIDDPLHGSLEVFSMVDPPDYAAISYTWGEDIFPHTLHLLPGCLQITRSLYGALRNFRSLDVTVRLWADQVCIAQHDMSEKNHQVESMADIYREAEEVLVWLGEARPSDCLAHWTLKFLIQFHQAERTHMEETSRVYPRSITELPAAFSAYKFEMGHEIRVLPQCSVDDPDSVDLERALRSLTESIWSRSWFDRLWVVQEVAVAQTRTLRFGHHSYDLEYLDDAASSHSAAVTSGLIFPGHSEGSLLQRCTRMLSLTHDYEEEPSSGGQQLCQALVDTCGLVAKEDYDRIYALRALAHVEAIVELKPNYQIPLSKICTKATVAMLTVPSDWDLLPHIECEPPALCLALAGTQKFSSNPSWVLNVKGFTEQSFKSRNWYVQNARHVWVGSKLPLDVGYHSNIPDLLHLRGMFACRVLKICPESLHQARVVESVQHRVHEDVVALSTTSAHQYAAYHHFICQERPAKGAELGQGYFRELMLQGSIPYRESSELSREERVEPMDSNDRENIGFTNSSPGHAFFDLLEQTVPIEEIDCTRVLASTSNGDFGWMPNSSQPGDIVCLFQGGPYPFVIREREDGFYTLLGDAWIQGIMHGEAWPENKDDTYMIGLK